MSPDSTQLTRRTVVAAAAFVPLAALTASAQSTALSPAQMKILTAFIDRLIPRDELGPGAIEAGSQIYIDRVLAGPNAAEKTTFVEGLTAADAYARRTHGAPLADLSAEVRDQVLAAIEKDNAPFFNRILRLTLEGMFGDPFYGGNKSFAGWDLIRYPGPRPAVDASLQKMDVALEPYRRSAHGGEYK
jgi:gluconate 2-dehydrogenase gamma chain